MGGWRSAVGRACGAVALLFLVAVPSAAGRPAEQVGSLASSGPTASPGLTAAKYYVVGAPVNGRPDFLFAIAFKTLGNGNRYTEIYLLNKDRPQPDGGLLTDPAVLNPGWILLLPPDASGPDVRMGPLPPITPTGPPSTEPSHSPTPAPATGPVSRGPMPAHAPVTRAAARPAAKGSAGLPGAGIIAVALVVVCLGVVLRVMRGNWPASLGRPMPALSSTRRLEAAVRPPPAGRSERAEPAGVGAASR